MFTTSYRKVVPIRHHVTKTFTMEYPPRILIYSHPMHPLHLVQRDDLKKRLRNNTRSYVVSIGSPTASYVLACLNELIPVKRDQTNKNLCNTFSLKLFTVFLYKCYINIFFVEWVISEWNFVHIHESFFFPIFLNFLWCVLTIGTNKTVYSDPY